jgi:hypothetical protein
MFERTGVSVEKRRLERLSLVCSHLAGTKMEDDMFQSRLGVRFVAVIALSLSMVRGGDCSFAVNHGDFGGALGGG